MPNYARKNGRVYTVYSEPILDWHSPPDDFLVQTVIAENDAHFFMQFPGVAITDRPASQENTGPRPSRAQLIALADSDEMRKKLSEMPIGSSTLLQVETAMPKQGSAVGVVVEGAAVQDKALLEYRLASARNSQNLTVIRKFILKLWPGLSRDLDLIDQLEKEEAL